MSRKSPAVRRSRRSPGGAPFDRRILLASAVAHGVAAGLFLWFAPPGIPAPPRPRLLVSAEVRPCLEADPEPLEAPPPELEATLVEPLHEEALPEAAPDPRLAAVPDAVPRPAAGPPADGGILGLGSGRLRPNRWGRGGASVALATAPPAAEEALLLGPAPPPAVEPRPVDEPARLVRYSAPAYPEQARDRGLEGVVRLRVEVLADGTLGEIEVLESSGSDLLDRAAMDAVRKWGYRPAVTADRPVRSLLTLPKVRFSLR